MKKEEYSSLYSGILFNNKYLPDHIEGITQEYSFSHDLKVKFVKKYHLDKLTSNLNILDSAIVIMNYFHSRIRITSDLIDDNTFDSFELLGKAFEKEKQTVNMNQATKIFQDLLFACGIINRRVSLFPYSPYESFIYRLAEVFDRNKNSWVAFDFLNGLYYVDENKKALSVFEIRDCLANQKKIIPVTGSINNPKVVNSKKTFEKTIKNLSKYIFAFAFSLYNGDDINAEKMNIIVSPGNFDFKRYYSEKINFTAKSLKTNKMKDDRSLNYIKNMRTLSEELIMVGTLDLSKENLMFKE